MKLSTVRYAQLISFALVLFISTDKVVANEKNISLDGLLEEVKSGRLRDAKINKQRLDEFRNDLASQKNKLVTAQSQQKKQEELSEQREKEFEDNEKDITILQQRLNERLGSLKELFGVLQQVSGDAQGQFSNSIIQLHYPERAEYLAKFSEKMGQTSNLPSIEEIERLWFELQREMTESSKVARFQFPVITTGGLEENKEIVRIGAFNLISEGKYLRYIPETGRVVEFSRQPANRYMEGAKQISKASDETIAFTLDPVRGQLLALLVQAPNFSERISQGGVIGYFIIGLGVVSILLALFRFLILVIVDRKVSSQVANPEKVGDNPLGRIIDEYQSHKERDLETLELKLGEAVLRETPKINRGLSFLKIIAAVAPLMGLLGTVTGMIITFQAITLFGTGDPKLMAGGISQALVTTVLGLTVAIPTLLLHNIVQGKAKKITEVLEQEAVAIVAEQAEKSQNFA